MPTLYRPAHHPAYAWGDRPLTVNIAARIPPVLCSFFLTIPPRITQSYAYIPGGVIGLECNWPDGR